MIFSCCFDRHCELIISVCVSLHCKRSNCACIDCGLILRISIDLCELCCDPNGKIPRLGCPVSVFQCMGTCFQWRQDGRKATSYRLPRKNMNTTTSIIAHYTVYRTVSVAKLVIFKQNLTRVGGGRVPAVIKQGVIISAVTPPAVKIPCLNYKSDYTKRAGNCRRVLCNWFRKWHQNEALSLR